MVALTPLALFTALAAANAVLPRDYATINNDLVKINSDVVQLTKDTNAYNGGVNSAVPIQNDYNTLDSDINSANKDAGNSAAVSATDAQKVIDYINNTLEPNVAKAITALNSKSSYFKTDGLTGTVCNDLKTLNTDTTTLGNSLVAKTPSSKQSAAKSALNKVLADIQKGVSTYC